MGIGNFIFTDICCYNLANICLNLFNLTCPGNYSLCHYCSIFIGSHLLRHLAPKSFVFYSDFRHQQVNNQIFFPSLPPSPYIMTFGFAVLTFHFLPFTCWWAGGSRSGICCQLSLAHIALWLQVSALIHSHPKINAYVNVMCNICLSVLTSLCNYDICMYTA